MTSVEKESAEVRRGGYPMYYLGGVERLRLEKAGQFLVKEGSHGPAALFVVNFETMEDLKRYADDMDEIRNTSKGLWEKHRSGRLSDMEYREEMENRWMVLVQVMLAKYKRDLIPFDIRYAMNEVEIGLEKSQTQWPPRRLITSDLRSALVIFGADGINGN